MDAEGEMVTVQCAWCGTILREGGKTISHGICRDCAPELLERIRERLDSAGKPPAPDGPARDLKRASGD
ncbi:MAG: hypothetical protein KC482_14320 [Dehalococcoidia bacterium]|nr:hypothetical protein [Dehalococcoidia bacterium]MCA9826354.1 hypothetical protein [Dehalococcoidia bacterium]MCA9844597.1 hypothetical protein [Dehalococcoidia bacterium]MCA9854738.1 hypothetical protein [Dehalococcoidia bacterium]